MPLRARGKGRGRPSTRNPHIKLTNICTVWLVLLIFGGVDESKRFRIVPGGFRGDLGWPKASPEFDRSPVVLHNLFLLLYQASVLGAAKHPHDVVSLLHPRIDSSQRSADEI